MGYCGVVGNILILYRCTVRPVIWPTLEAAAIPLVILSNILYICFLGFSIIYGVHKIPYRYFRGLSMVMIPVVLILLLITMLQGSTIGGANASRWIRVPIVGFTFQPSTLAALVLMVYVARYLSKIKDETISFKESILPLWLPVFVVLALILPANFSTAALIFSMVILLTFLGGYPLKYLSLL